jgi:hypothetical protein
MSEPDTFRYYSSMKRYTNDLNLSSESNIAVELSLSLSVTRQITWSSYNSFAYYAARFEVRETMQLLATQFYLQILS